MAGVDAILQLATEPGDGVVINTPVYPPFFEHITAVAGSASGQRLLARLPSWCQFGAGLFGVLASLAAWSSGDDRHQQRPAGRHRGPDGRRCRLTLGVQFPWRSRQKQAARWSLTMPQACMVA